MTIATDYSLTICELNVAFEQVEFVAGGGAVFAGATRLGNGQAATFNRRRCVEGHDSMHLRLHLFGIVALSEVESTRSDLVVAIAKFAFSVSHVTVSVCKVGGNEKSGKESFHLSSDLVFCFIES